MVLWTFPLVNSLSCKYGKVQKNEGRKKRESKGANRNAMCIYEVCSSSSSSQLLPFFLALKNRPSSWETAELLNWMQQQQCRQRHVPTFMNFEELDGQTPAISPTTHVSTIKWFYENHRRPFVFFADSLHLQKNVILAKNNGWHAINLAAKFVMAESCIHKGNETCYKGKQGLCSASALFLASHNVISLNRFFVDSRSKTCGPAVSFGFAVEWKNCSCQNMEMMHA